MLELLLAAAKILAVKVGTSIDRALLAWLPYWSDCLVLCMLLALWYKWSFGKLICLGQSIF